MKKWQYLLALPVAFFTMLVGGTSALANDSCGLASGGTFELSLATNGNPGGDWLHANGEGNQVTIDFSASVFSASVHNINGVDELGITTYPQGNCVYRIDNNGIYIGEGSCCNPDCSNANKLWFDSVNSGACVLTNVGNAQDMETSGNTYGYNVWAENLTYFRWIT